MNGVFHAFIGGSKSDCIELLPPMKPGERVHVPVFEIPAVHWNPRESFPVRTNLAIDVYEHTAPNALTFKFRMA
jgi:hypothetical protein